MANEINFAYQAGKTLQAAIYANGWVQQGANIALTETGAGTGLYVGSVPGAPAIADGVYQVLFIDTIGPPVNQVVGRGPLYWAANAEDREAVESVLDSVLADTAAMEPLVTAALDATISSRAAPGAPMDLIAGAFATIQASILSDSTPFDGADIAAILASTTALQQFIEGGRDIDFVGNDLLGWQRIERNTTGTELARYNLFDDSGSRINEAVPTFLARAGMISAEVKI